ncbi:MAG TPA: M81 family metallopeptidase [Tepidisphaeraceae bacterium]|jgi:microcystin degradation protein MlrC|nr:M81 family metallopeptidase [Tepidisphaeraceae bacterium]
MRVGIIALNHESNTFLPKATTLDDFRRNVLVTGEAVREHFHKSHHELGGFFDGLSSAGVEAVPLFAAIATPGGVVTAEAFEHLLATMLDCLDRAGPLAGILAAPHGAGVSERFPDMDGHWMGLVRQRFGAKPIIATIDPHANLSLAMVNACQAIIPYRTNPHVDQHARGLEAAALMVRTLRGEVRPTMAAAFPTVAINIAAQHTESPPCLDLVRLADAQLKLSGVLSNGVVLGFPYADVPEMGSSFIVVTDNDQEQAGGLADQLGNYLVAHRRDFVPQLPSVEEAIDQALRSEMPVCLLDLGDNVGGGSPGDGTIIARALRRRRIERSFVALCDADAANAAALLGAGAVFEGLVGGKSDKMHGEPLPVQGRVRSLHDGVFNEDQIRHGAQGRFDMGKTAVVESESLTLLVHSRRTPPFSLNQLTSCGIEPRKFAVLVAKGVNAPIAAYSPVCRTFIRVDTPGVTTANMTRLPFQHRRRPLFPFEELR